jgi:hypothetical protein
MAIVRPGCCQSIASGRPEMLADVPVLEAHHGVSVSPRDVAVAKITCRRRAPSECRR